MRKRSPNIIVCTCDQLRAFETGCYGNDFVRTPNIDSLAREGVRFETAVTNFPVCMAARSVLISGQYNRACTGGVGNVSYPAKPGEYNMPEYPEAGRPHLKAPTMAESLRACGYHTAAIGKWHIHSWPHDVGFDYYLIPRVHHCHTGQSFTENGGPEFIAPGYSVDFEAERVKTFLARRGNTNQPFFLYYNISPPHCPLADAPEKYLKMYDPADIPLRANVDVERVIPKMDYWLRVYRYDFRYYNLRLPYTEIIPDNYGWRELTAEYLGLTTWADDVLGVMLGALDASGMAGETIVVFVSDHGDNLGSLGLVQKGGPNEESIRIPMIFRCPGQAGRGGTVVSGQVASLVDVMPTVLDLAGAEIPGHIHGQSLAPVIRGEAQRVGEDSGFIETSEGACIRSPRYSYFLPYAGPDKSFADKPKAFYDLEADPLQARNLAGVPGHEKAAADLDARLRAWDARIPWMDF